MDGIADGTPHARGGGGILGTADGSEGAHEFVMYARKYFMFWALFIFCIVFVIVIRPSSVFYLDPATGRRSFIWTSFFMCVLSMYAFILLIVWAHRLCRSG